MQTFLQQHSDHIHGVLSGLDRVRFRGTLRSICYADGFSRYLGFLKVLLVAFKSFFDGTARRLKLATERLAATTPVGKVVYLSGTIDKEAVVHDLIRQHAVADDFTGVIAVLSCVENCRSFQLYKNAATRMLELVSAQRKCLHYYIYLHHPRFGMMHIRLMTWFPMSVQICLNGREWLARQLDAAGIEYRADNSLAWVADFPKAQALFDEQLQTDWSATLTGVIRESHPEFARLLTEWQLRDYYWTAEQTEWATDVAFRSVAALRPLYRRLVRHATENLSSPDVLRFLQQRLTKAGALDGRFQGEVVSSTKTHSRGDTREAPPGSEQFEDVRQVRLHLADRNDDPSGGRLEGVPSEGRRSEREIGLATTAAGRGGPVPSLPVVASGQRVVLGGPRGRRVPRDARPGSGGREPAGDQSGPSPPGTEFDVAQQWRVAAHDQPG